MRPSLTVPALIWLSRGTVMQEPVAYFLTFTTYRTWLPGCAPGSIYRPHNAFGTPGCPPDPQRESSRQRQMRQPEYTLDPPRRRVALHTILEVARHRGWTLYAVHVRTTHVHI